MTHAGFSDFSGRGVTSVTKKKYEVRVRETVMVEAIYVVEASCESEARSLAAAGITTSREDVKKHEPSEILVRPVPVRRVKEPGKPDMAELERKVGGNDGAEITIGPLSVSLENMTCFYHGKRLRISAVQLRIIYAMAMKPDVVFSREDILKYFRSGMENDDRSVDSAIKKIRHAVGKDDGPAIIRTSYGNGYALNLEFLAPDQIEGIVETGFRVDTLRRKVFWCGENMHVTAAEFEILEALTRHPGIVMTRERLFKLVGKFSEDIRTVDSHIKRIRRRMRKMNIDDKMIETVYSIGYRIRKA